MFSLFWHSVLSSRYPSELYDQKKNDKGEWALVMCWVLVGNAYCITRGTDYTGKTKLGEKDECDLHGLAMDKQFDTHFVQVDPDLGYQAMDPKRPPKETWEEIVVKNEAQLLPRYIVFFTK